MEGPDQISPVDRVDVAKESRLELWPRVSRRHVVGAGEWTDCDASTGRLVRAWELGAVVTVGTINELLASVGGRSQRARPERNEAAGANRIDELAPRAELADQGVFERPQLG